MRSIVTIRTMTLGDGRPKICVPLTDTHLDALIRSARALSDAPFDFVEWRADHYEGLTDAAARTAALQALRETLGDVPILFTIRTTAEGGLANLPVAAYIKINQSVIESGLADLVDVELSKGDSVLESLAASAHRHGVKIVGSKHDFSKTPAEEAIITSLCRMQALGADVAKYAVMPTCEQDVLTLLSATLTMKLHHSDTPVITMSMGPLGAVSRVCGELTGSAVTFGTVGRASAPGQLQTDVLQTFLQQLTLETVG